MKIAVAGLWHLGCVTAACLAANGFEVIAYDTNERVIEGLKQSILPIFEPGLQELLSTLNTKKNLHFTSQRGDLNQAEILWITIDTPVDDNDKADVAFVKNEIEKCIPYLSKNSIILISSQLPIGTTRQLMNANQEVCGKKNITFAYSPENLRLGKAIEVFTKPDRVVMGLQTNDDKIRLEKLFFPFTSHLVWMSIESAEMTKHAINAFLATSVVFINEIATLCEQVGANAREVEVGLKTEERIGPKAYLRPGSAIAGGTLLRDIHYLLDAGKDAHISLPFISAILESNHTHQQWSCQRLLKLMKGLKNKTIATLGLTYKAGTNTLRRSAAIETCLWLSTQGAKVVAFDPSIDELPAQFKQHIELKKNMDEALKNADAAIITTEWPQFASLNSQQLLSFMTQPILLDASGFLAQTLGTDPRISYYSVGR